MGRSTWRAARARPGRPTRTSQPRPNSVPSGVHQIVREGETNSRSEPSPPRGGAALTPACPPAGSCEFLGPTDGAYAAISATGFFGVITRRSGLPAGRVLAVPYASGGQASCRIPGESWALRMSLLLSRGGAHACSVRRVTIDDPERALQALHEEVVPRVSALPGLVAGYWLRPEANQGRSLVVFESEDAARAAAENVRANAPEFVTFDTVDVVEVVAHT